jgi:hypothetical protein
VIVKVLHNGDESPQQLERVMNKLRDLSKLSEAVLDDIEAFLDSPETFAASEYFEDVLSAAREVYLIAQELNVCIFGKDEESDDE